MPYGVLTVQRVGPGKCAHSRTATARALCGESRTGTVSFLASMDDRASRRLARDALRGLRGARSLGTLTRDGRFSTMARHRPDIFLTHRDNPLAGTRYAL